MLGLCILVSASRCGGESRATSNQEAHGSPPRLSCSDGQLSFASDAGSQVLLSAEAPLPYRTVSSGQPQLITYLTDELVPCTIAAGLELHTYADMLPVLSLGSLTVLSSASIENDATARLLLLWPDGRPGWEQASAELLWPLDDSAGPVPYIAVAGSAPDLIFPFGRAPQLVAVDPAQMQERWRITLKADYPVASITVHAVSAEAGLLSLQYDYTVFEFLVFDPDSGRILQRQMLEGQPVTSVVYPGPAYESAAPVIASGSISVDVFFESRDLQRWTFSTAGGELSKAMLDGPGVSRREENPAPLGPLDDAQAAPLPQRLLPEAGSKTWECPAHIDGLGRVLVVDKAGPRWLQLPN
jgi:hypothetical protein